MKHDATVLRGWLLTVTVTIAVVGVARGEAVAPDLPSRTLALFEQKCAQCHGARAVKPKKFGYIDDLARLAATPKYVVPRDAEHSELWTSVRDGDMPPDDSDVPPLTVAEKAVVREWIEAGAPS